MENLRSDNLIDNPLEEKINSVIQGKGDHLHAIMRDKDVHLSGDVSCRAAKEEISGLVKNFPGIRIITNHIRIKLPEERRHVEHF
jgi:osmotically-inducible protein OsmY